MSVKSEIIKAQICALNADKNSNVYLAGNGGCSINLDEGALRVLERYYNGEEVLFRSDYFATKLWSPMDIACRLNELGYEPSEENVKAVIKEGGAWNCLTEIDDSEWSCIDYLIKEAMRKAEIMKEGI